MLKNWQPAAFFVGCLAVGLLSLRGGIKNSGHDGQPRVGNTSGNRSDSSEESQGSDERTVTVEDGPVAARFIQVNPRILRLHEERVVITAESAAQPKVTLRVRAKTNSTIEGSHSNGKWSFTVSVTDANGHIDFFLEGEKEPFRTLEFFRPSGKKPRIPSFVRGAHERSPLLPLPQNALSVPLIDGFVRIHVADLDARAQANDFALFTRKNGILTSVPSQVREVAGQPGLFDFSIDLPGLDKGPADKLFVLLQRRDGTHAYSDLIDLNNAIPDALQLPTAPVIKTIQGKSAVSGEVNVREEVQTVVGELSLPTIVAPDSRENYEIWIFKEGHDAPIGHSTLDFTKSPPQWTAQVAGTLRGESHRIFAFAYAGRSRGKGQSSVVTLSKRTGGLHVESIEPENFGTAPGVTQIRVKFNRENPVAKAKAEVASSYHLYASKGTQFFHEKINGNPTKADLEESTNTVVLTCASLPADIYRLEILGSEIEDVFGNPLEGAEGQPKSNHVHTFKGPRDLKLPTSFEPKTKFTPYPEFTAPRPKPNGFNPGDHVETRVVRLYYYRDAHRVAQIINRDLKAYNLPNVEELRRLAQEAREKADKLVDQRRELERKAVNVAKETRQIEKDLEQANQFLSQELEDNGLRKKLFDRASEDFDTADKRAKESDPPAKSPDRSRVDAARDELVKSHANVKLASDRVSQLQRQLQVKRAEEVQANEENLKVAAQEDRAKEESFRRDIAAAKADPDSFAPGMPESADPVRQVSIAVIGEAVLQLRGPINGVNIVRQMVHQIDSPVAQVKIGMHTVQVNGERGDRMEKVIGKIQDYIDHSRFLTAQSAQMLRKAVGVVASRKAQEASVLFPGNDQEARDQRYIYAFFGRDFVEELRALDSEFLRTGNKLLSLHSMDTTSLASALFILALAKNETRMEILQEFRVLLDSELPISEQRYFEAGGVRKQGRRECFMLLAQNAKFESFFGFFNHQIAGDDTITPFQREFIRLAQILKTQLVTELEMKRRIDERSLIEERIGTDYLQMLEKAKAQEDQARQNFEDTRTEIRTVLGKLFPELQRILQQIDAVAAEVDTMNSTVTTLVEAINDSIKRELKRRGTQVVVTSPQSGSKRVTGTQRAWSDFNQLVKQASREDLKFICVEIFGTNVKLQVVGENTVEPIQARLLTPLLGEMRQLFERLQQIEFKDQTKGHVIRLAQLWNKVGDTVSLESIRELSFEFNHLAGVVASESSVLKNEIDRLFAEFSAPDFTVRQGFDRWQAIRQKIIISTKQGSELRKYADVHLARPDKAFQDLLALALKYEFARQDAEKARRPLDHKKLLDMLIDEVQDKYVELLEGTRSHTANIDEYIKRIATALDDDFQTQYYYPAFREVRNASRMWDVTLGQIETTTILTNNRSFAAVEPQATMEFDLPRRKILITEAMQGAKGMVDTYGALLQDPTFLNLTKLGAGLPTSSLMTGQAGGLSPIRNVLPGLDRFPDARALSQVAPTSLTYGTPLDALIPEPAVYKFETGTGFQLRPVIQPDGQSVVFHLNYMYTTNLREPVRADEKHLGRVKRHFIDTNVQLGNYELREVSRYQVALRASRTAKGVPLLQDIPGLGVLFRPLPSAESSLQQNIILSQATIFPTLFDLMGLRWAPVVADLDPLSLANADFVVRQRKKDLMNRVFDFSSSKVDEALRIPEAQRRTDLYRAQETIPTMHPNGYQGPGLNLRDSHMQEGYSPLQGYPPSQFGPSVNPNGAIYPPKAPLPGGAMPGATMPGAPGGGLPGLPMKPSDGGHWAPHHPTPQGAPDGGPWGPHAPTPVPHGSKAPASPFQMGGQSGKTTATPFPLPSNNTKGPAFNPGGNVGGNPILDLPTPVPPPPNVLPVPLPPGPRVSPTSMSKGLPY